MSNATFCTRIFDPMFTYNQAARHIGEQNALESLLKNIGYEHLVERNAEFDRVYPVKAMYHSYKRHIGVIIEGEPSFRIQTFIDGVPEESFDMKEERDEVKNFFERAGSELTVIDFFSGRELVPDFQVVKKYIDCIADMRDNLSEHKSTISDFKARLQKLKLDGEGLLGGDPSSFYRQTIRLFEGYLEAAEEAFYSIWHKAQKEAEKSVLNITAKEARVRMFGLYVYALSYGLSRKRFLRKNSTMLSRTFSQMLSDMRGLVAEDDGLVDRYIGQMELSRNERENLLFMLDEEGITRGLNKFIGDELFA